MAKRKIYKGFLDCNDYSAITIGTNDDANNDDQLIEEIAGDFKAGEQVSIQYYVSDKEITEEQALEAHVIKTIGGEIDNLDFALCAYSAWTVLEFTEEFKVGGHDLAMELSTFGRKYLILIITSK